VAFVCLGEPRVGGCFVREKRGGGGGNCGSGEGRCSHEDGTLWMDRVADTVLAQTRWNSHSAYDAHHPHLLTTKVSSMKRER
jgi:hypothetical protein